MENKLAWRDALKQFNDNRIKDGESILFQSAEPLNMPVLEK